MPVPELERRASSTSPGASKTSLPYPSFSKAHSKEAVGSRDNVANPRLSYYTPDPTDLEQGKKQSEENGPNNITGAAPQVRRLHTWTDLKGGKSRSPGKGGAQEVGLAESGR